MLRRGGGHGDDGNADAVAARDLLEIVNVVNRHAAARLLSHFRAERIEQGGDLEAFLAEPGIVGEREAEIAGAHDGDAQLSVEAQNLSEVPLQIAHVVADAADAELAEVGEVFADLSRVQVELLGERPRGNRADAGPVEHVQAPQVERQAIGGELGDLIGAWLAGGGPGRGFVRGFHKLGPIVTKTPC